MRLNLSGKCAINVVDNLVFIHHPASKETYVYDIEEKSQAQCDGFQTIHQPLLSPMSIQPVSIQGYSLSPTVSTETQIVELYSSNWIVFQPNVIIDVQLGLIWYLLINLDCLLELIDNRILLVEILLRRTNGKGTIIALLRTLLMNIITPIQIDSVSMSDLTPFEALDCWTEIIARINQVHHENNSNRQRLDQNDICSVLNLFSTMVSMSSMNNTLNYDRSLSIVTADVLLDEQDSNKNVKFAVSIILEYIRSLNEYNIPVEYSIFEILVDLIVKSNQFFQLQQLIQYQVLSDSVKLGKRKLKYFSFFF